MRGINLYLVGIIVLCISLNMVSSIRYVDNSLGVFPSTASVNTDVRANLFNPVQTLYFINVTVLSTADPPEICILYNGSLFNSPILMTGSFQGLSCNLNSSILLIANETYSLGTVGTPNQSNLFNDTYRYNYTNNKIRFIHQAWDSGPNVFNYFNYGQESYGVELIDNTSITLTNPDNNNLTLSNNINFSASLQQIEGTLKNGTLFVWNLNGSLINQTTNIVTANQGITNYTNFSLLNFPLENYKWNVLGCTVNVCSFASSNFTFSVGIEKVISGIPTSRYETETANNNLTFNISSGTPSVYFNYNGTRTLTTGTNNGLNWLYTRSNDIPGGSLLGKNVFWEVYVGSLNYNTTKVTQSINAINFSVCSTGNVYLNFTYRNETSLQQKINASVSTISWTYYIGSGAETKSFSYVNSTEWSYTQFCFDPSQKTVYADISYAYTNAESNQRIYSPSTLTLQNNSLLKTLYLLPTSANTFPVTIQVVNVAQQPLSGVTIDISRTGIGIVETKITDDAGAVSVFLDLDFPYTITATRGSETVTVSTSSGQTSYTITMGQSAGSNVTDYSRGINYHLAPTQKILFNQTNYVFNFTIASTFNSLDSFGFVLKNGSGTFITSASSTSSTGGTVSATVNTAFNSSILMEYYWVINTTYTNASYTWNVINSSDNDFSINHFVTDLKNYLSQGDGLFGMKSSSLSFVLVLFVIIFVIMGVLSLNFGITSPVTLSFVLLLIVGFFDVYLELVPRSSAVPLPLPTIFIGIIFIGLLYREVQR